MNFKCFKRSHTKMSYRNYRKGLFNHLCFVKRKNEIRGSITLKCISGRMIGFYIYRFAAVLNARHQIQLQIRVKQECMCLMFVLVDDPLQANLFTPLILAKPNICLFFFFFHPSVLKLCCLFAKLTNVLVCRPLDIRHYINEIICL